MTGLYQSMLRRRGRCQGRVIPSQLFKQARRGAGEESALMGRGRVSEVTREYGSRLAMSKIAAHSTAFSYASQDCRAIADTGTKGTREGRKGFNRRIGLSAQKGHFSGSNGHSVATKRGPSDSSLFMPIPIPTLSLTLAITHPRTHTLPLSCYAILLNLR